MFVYLVHGTFASPSDWPADSILVDRLYAAGMKTRSLSWTGGNSHTDRLRAAEELALQITTHGEAGSDTIAVVGHSHGGTIVHYAMQFLRPPLRKRVRVVTLGSPVISTSRFSKANVLRAWRRGLLCFLRPLDLLLWMYLFTLIASMPAWGNQQARLLWGGTWLVFGLLCILWGKAVGKRCLEMWIFDAELTGQLWLGVNQHGHPELKNGPLPDNPDDYAYGHSLVAAASRRMLRWVAHMYDKRTALPDVGLALDVAVLSITTIADEAIAGLTCLKWIQRQLQGVTRLFAWFCSFFFRLNTHACVPFMILFPFWHLNWLPGWLDMTMLTLFTCFVYSLILVPCSLTVAITCSVLARRALFWPFGFGNGFAGLLWESIHLNTAGPDHERFRVPLWTLFRRSGRGLLLHGEYYNLPVVVDRILAFLKA